MSLIQIAAGFVENGATVYIASRTADALTQTADALNKLGKGKCFPIVGDLSKFEDCVKLAEELGRKEQCMCCARSDEEVWGLVLMW